MHAALKQALLEWRTQSHRIRPDDYVFPSRLHTSASETRCPRYKLNRAVQVATSLPAVVRPIRHGLLPIRGADTLNSIFTIRHGLLPIRGADTLNSIFRLSSFRERPDEARAEPQCALSPHQRPG